MPEQKTVGQATASLVLGILSFIMCGITAIPAVICGHVAKSKIKGDPENLKGDGLALSGLIMGYVCIGISIILIPLYAVIAVPSFAKARENAQAAACRNNLRTIDVAKEQYAVDNNVMDGAPVQATDLAVYISGGVAALKCPDEGKYSINPLGTSPKCSVHGEIEQLY